MALCSFLMTGAQEQVDSQYITVLAGKHYATSERHQKRWGEHYRREWNTPVRIKVAMLDTLAGGLTPYQEGGGRQSKTLRLRDKKGKEYVLRSIDKTLSGALPDIAKGTFVEAIANDQVSIAHPYAALIIPPMAEAARILHTNPKILFIPKQQGLGEYSESYGDMLYLFEQRPDENWEEAVNFGNAKNIVGTDKMKEKMLEDADKKIDQPAFARARLFDLLIGDWGRHEDQWRWAAIEKNNKTIYKPVPRDRDQAFTKFDGNMVTLLFSVAGFDHLQSFENEIEDVTIYNFPARNLDRLAANELTRQDWIAEAKHLQSTLTDLVIENAVRQLPPEVFPISGEDIIGKLKSRRDKLEEYAIQYYQFIAKNVDIPASQGKDLILVDRTSDDHTSVQIFKIGKKGGLEKSPYYQRTFFTHETDEIRIYGLEGDDRFSIQGNTGKSSLLRIIPGPGKDSIKDVSAVRGNKKMTRIYDDEHMSTGAGREARLIVSDDAELNNYDYTHFEYDKKGFVFRPGITLGAGYYIQKQKWRKYPFGSEHRIMGYYGPNRGAVALEYRYLVNQLIGKWDLSAIARLDFPYVANFFGVGNESVMNTDVNRKYYRYRGKALTTTIKIHRLIDSLHYFALNTGYQRLQVKTDEDRFITKHSSGLPASALEKKNYGFILGEYQLQKTDHPVVPTRGYSFNLSGGYTHDLNNPDRSIARYGSSVSFYLPLFKVFSLAMRAGGEAVTGKPEFFQLAVLSGKENLRGYRRQRFYGATSFYNNNELRLILNTRNRMFNGKYGLLVFVDQARVWQPGEESDLWHVGYGGGVFVAPFNRILLNATYGISKEDQVFHFRIGFLF